MRKIKYTLFSLALAATFTSCNFLDKEPYKITPEKYFQNEEEASRYLTGIYAPLAQGSFYGGDYMLLAGGDDLTCYGGSTGRISNTGLICNLATTSDPAVTAFWFTLYNGIERANYFIEQLGNITTISEEKREQFMAEARFLRAFYYFNLVQNWGDVPFKTESTMGTESISNKDIARTPKDKIYQFIVDELSEISDSDNGGLMSASELNYLPGRVSKSAAWGILSRVYMFWAGEHYRDKLPAPADKVDKFGKALEYGLKVYKEGGHELSPKYWDVFIDMCADRYDSTKKHESIWEIEFAGDGTGDVRSEGRIGNTMGIQCADFSSKTNVVGKADPGYAYAFLWATPKLYDLYGYLAPYGNKLDTQTPTWTGIGYGKEEEPIVRDDRFIWNIAPFTYKTCKSHYDLGVLGRVFDNKDLYYWVMGIGEFAGQGYGEQSYTYGLNEADPVFSSSKDQHGDVYKTAPTSDIKRNEARKDLCCAKFRREYEPAKKKNKNMTSINFPVLRYSDVLLMIAEAENEVNGPENAYMYINEVRRRAGLADLESNLSQDEFREEIKDERAREFCFELTRRYDLIRWGDYIKNMNDLAPIAPVEKNWSQGQQVANFFNIPEAYNYFPIPESEKSVNKLIKGNNPGW